MGRWAREVACYGKHHAMSDTLRDVRPVDAPAPLMLAEIPDHERPRERLLRLGADALSDEELLAILIRTGTRGQSVLDLARRVLRHYGNSLNDIAAAKVPEFLQIKGIGTAKAVEIHAAFTLAKRLAVPGLKALPRLNEPGTVYGLLREDFRNVPQERFLALLLDTKNQLLRTEAVTIGLADQIGRAHV